MVVLSPETLVQLFGLRPEDVDCSGMKLYLDKVFVFKGSRAIKVNSKVIADVEEIKDENGAYLLEAGSIQD
jgi:hypothetical protein